jgi:OOP family OmpA-OmpF porin
MRSKVTIAILGIAAATLALPAAAQMRMSSAYIGGGVGQSKFKDGCAGGTFPGASCDDKDTSFRLFGGYQFNRNIAAELGYADLGKAKASAAGVSEEAKATAWDLSAVGTFPVWQQLSVLGRLGAYHGEGKLSGVVSGKKNTTNVTFGVGAQYDFTRNLGVRAEWQRYSKLKFEVSGASGDTDVDVLGVSVLWRFQ